MQSFLSRGFQVSDALLFDDGLNAKWRQAVDDHKRHAHEQFPREAVGLVSQDGSYVPCDNVASDPLNHFEVAEQQQMSVDEGRFAAVLHSHTSTAEDSGKTTSPADCPSRHDMERQAATAVPWGITRCVEGGADDPFWFGDQVPRPPLYGRSFRHGVNDCYSFIRDWHKQEAGLVIPDFPRDLDWWEKVGDPDDPDKPVRQPLDMYVEGFAKAGFKRVDRSRDPLPGDVFLCSIKSDVMNHGGVYLGGGLIGHHILWELSAKRPAHIWRPRLTFLVRHESLPDDWREDSVAA